MTVEKKDIDWGSLGFGYMKTDYSYEAHWKDGEWDEGGLTTDHTLHVSECGGIFHYCQEVFEGLKAYTAEDGSIVCFRPDMNAERMYNSAQRLEMPPFPKDKFVEAVKQVVSANAAWVPPFGSGATLYVRPFMIGHFFGRKIIASGKVKAMTPERIKKSEDFLDKWGHLAIFLGRFFPFIRTFVPFIAGMGGMHWRNFVVFNVLGGITWSTVFTLLGYFFGGIPFVQEHFELLIIGIVAVSIIPAVVGLVKAKLGKKNA